MTNDEALDKLEMRVDYCDALETIASWQEASGLTRGGDPGGVTPEDLRCYLQALYRKGAEYDARCDALRAEVERLRAEVERMSPVVDAVCDEDIAALPQEVRNARLAYQFQPGTRCNDEVR